MLAGKLAPPPPSTAPTGRDREFDDLPFPSPAPSDRAGTVTDSSFGARDLEALEPSAGMHARELAEKRKASELADLGLVPSAPFLRACPRDLEEFTATDLAAVAAAANASHGAKRLRSLVEHKALAAVHARDLEVFGEELAGRELAACDVPFTPPPLWKRKTTARDVEVFAADTAGTLDSLEWCAHLGVDRDRFVDCASLAERAPAGRNAEYFDESGDATSRTIPATEAKPPLTAGTLFRRGSARDIEVFADTARLGVAVLDEIKPPPLAQAENEFCFTSPRDTEVFS